jgi:hypothetical protein
MHLSGLKMFLNSDEQEKVKNLLNIVPDLKVMQNEQVERDYQLISNLICCFVDFMKILAPQIELEEPKIKVTVFTE